MNGLAECIGTTMTQIYLSDLRFQQIQCLVSARTEEHVFFETSSEDKHPTQCKGKKVEVMNSTYVFLCGVAWCQFGEEAAGSELIRALSSADSKIRVLARTMLSKAGLRSKALIGEAMARQEMSPVQASLCMFEQEQVSTLPVLEHTALSLPAAA